MFIKNKSALRSLWSSRGDTVNKPKYARHRGIEKYYCSLGWELFPVVENTYKEGNK